MQARLSAHCCYYARPGSTAYDSLDLAVEEVALSVVEFVRDIAIIVLAVFQLIAALAIIVLAWQVWRLVRLVHREFGNLSTRTGTVIEQARDAAASAADSARTVKGSVSFVSDTVVNPVIGIGAAVAGATRFVDALFRNNRRHDEGGTPT